MLLKLIQKLMAGAVAPGTQHPELKHESGQLQRARVLYDSGNMTAAQGLYEQILRLQRDNSEAQYYLGAILGRAGHYAAAEELLRKVIAKEPQWVDALNALGNIEKMQEHWGSAEDYYRRALAIQPDTAAIWSNLGLCLRESGQAEAAEAALRRALQLLPGSPDALVNLAMIAADTGKQDEARVLLQRVLAIDADLAEAHTGLAHLLLKNGEFAEGWREYEWRFKCSDAGAQRELSFPHWDGAPIKDRVLLVRAEQGLGDQIMLASCLPEVIERAGLCLIECEPRLVSLFARSFPLARFYPYYAKREPQWAGNNKLPDYQIHLGSLPALYRRQAGDFPQHDGYLRADPERVAYWRSRLAGLGAGLKVGISWRGGAPRTRRALRSLALGEWLPILQQAGAQFVSLQYDDSGDEIDALARSAGVRVHHWQDAIDDYDETAALVAALDRVISVQTAVVHLAGALGTPTWVLVPVVPEWRYLAQGTTMPWYPSVLLMRQNQRGEWRPVIDQIAQLLAMEINNFGKLATA